MADLDVQPKKKSGSLVPWILLGLGILALLIFLGRGCNDDSNTTTEEQVITTDTSHASNGAATSTGARDADNWADVNFSAPAVSYPEITDKNIDVRGNGNYGIYGLGENILFDEGKSTLRPQAESNLRQIAASINQRFNGGDVRVYGYTDATGSAGSNKELAEQRAEAVRNCLVKNGNIGEDKLSLHPVGESQPVATNATESGRQQNRRVKIVARGGNNNSTSTDTSAGR